MEECASIIDLDKSNIQMNELTHCVNIKMTGPFYSSLF